MKLRLCVDIARNLGRLLSYEFWETALSDKDFPTGTIVLLTLFAACSDILQMLLVPGYPGKTAT